MSQQQEEYLAKFGACIAAHMPGWAVSKVMTTAFHLSGPDGMGLIFWACAGTIRVDAPASIRLEVSGVYDLNVCIQDKEKPRNITVAASRPAGRIAKDVDKRFLSKYIPLYYKKLELHNKIMEEREARARVMVDLAQAFGWKVVKESDGMIRRVEEGYGRSKINANYTTKLAPESERRWEVDLDLRKITIWQAMRIADVLKEPAFPPEQLTLL